MARYEIHLFKARGLHESPLIISTYDWSIIVRAAAANGGTAFETFAPYDAKLFARAVRRALDKPPRPQPVHRRSHVPDYLQPADHAANLAQAKASGVLDQVLALFDGPDGVTVQKTTARQLRALAPR